MPEPFKQLSAYEQEYYLDKSVQNDLTRNAKEAAYEQAKMIKMGGMKDPYAEKPQQWGIYGGGGQGDTYGERVNEEYRNRPIIPTPEMYQKTPHKNLMKTIKQVQSAIYTPKKPKALTKSQKIVIAEMFGKQITTNPKKKQKIRR